MSSSLFGCVSGMFCGSGKKSLSSGGICGGFSGVSIAQEQKPLFDDGFVPPLQVVPQAQTTCWTKATACLCPESDNPIDSQKTSGLRPPTTFNPIITDLDALHKSDELPNSNSKSVSESTVNTQSSTPSNSQDEHHQDDDGLIKIPPSVVLRPRSGKHDLELQMSSDISSSNSLVIKESVSMPLAHIAEFMNRISHVHRQPNNKYGSVYRIVLDGKYRLDLQRFNTTDKNNNMDNFADVMSYYHGKGNGEYPLFYPGYRNSTCTNTSGHNIYETYLPQLLQSRIGFDIKNDKYFRTVRQAHDAVVGVHLANLKKKNQKQYEREKEDYTGMRDFPHPAIFVYVQNSPHDRMFPTSSLPFPTEDQITLWRLLQM